MLPLTEQDLKAARARAGTLEKAVRKAEKLAQKRASVATPPVKKQRLDDVYKYFRARRVPR